MKIKICVTKQDIKNGKPQSCHNCPIALAVKRALKKTKDLRFGAVGTYLLMTASGIYPRGEVRLKRHREELTLSASRRTARFIIAFDDFDPEVLKHRRSPGRARTIAQHKRFKKRIRPFSFMLSIPDAKGRRK